MKSTLHTYADDRIEVAYDSKRCIHFAACVRGLPDVFDPKRRPWVEPEQGEPEAIAAVVMQCPTGALHFTMKDGSLVEPTPEGSEIRVKADGPLYAHGQESIDMPAGDKLLDDVRVALCRCGRSSNKPLCDGSHHASDDSAAFQDAGAIGLHKATVADDLTGELTGTPLPDGPIVATGPMTLTSADGATNLVTGKAALCRCGHSSNKPFCDGSHKAAGFTA